MKNFGLLLLAATLLFTACNEDEPILDIAPQITSSITKADINCMPCAGTDLNIVVNVSDVDEIHEVHTSLYQSFMMGEIDVATEVMHIHGHADAMTYSIDTTYMIDSAHHSNFYLVIMAEDHNGNMSRDTSSIHIHM